MVEFRVLQCASCETFQVLQVTRSSKWKCKLCGLKQSLKKVYGQGTGADCRRHVQKLNTLRGHVAQEVEEIRLSYVARMDNPQNCSDSLAGFSSVNSNLDASTRQSRWSAYIEPVDEGADSDVQEHAQQRNPADSFQVITDRVEFEASRKRAIHERRKERRTIHKAARYEARDSISEEFHNLTKDERSKFPRTCQVLSKQAFEEPSPSPFTSGKRNLKKSSVKKPAPFTGTSKWAGFLEDETDDSSDGENNDTSDIKNYNKPLLVDASSIPGLQCEPSQPTNERLAYGSFGSLFKFQDAHINEAKVEFFSEDPFEVGWLGPTSKIDGNRFSELKCEYGTERYLTHNSPARISPPGCYGLKTGLAEDIDSATRKNTQHTGRSHSVEPKRDLGFARGIESFSRKIVDGEIGDLKLKANLSAQPIKETFELPKASSSKYKSISVNSGDVFRCLSNGQQLDSNCKLKPFVTDGKVMNTSEVKKIEKSKEGIYNRGGGIFDLNFDLDENDFEL